VRQIPHEKWLVDVGIGANALLIVGVLWDALYHQEEGHYLLAPPHLLTIAMVLGLLFYSEAVLAIRYPYTAKEALALFFRGRWISLVRHVKIDKGARPLLFVLGGSLLMVVGFGVDELWHLAFGLDQTAWSPPHIVIWSGWLIELAGLVRLTNKGALWPIELYQRQTICMQDVRLVLLGASVLMISFNLFIEYQIPGAVALTKVRPDWFYPVSATLTIGVLIYSFAHSIPRPFLSYGSLAGWIFFAGIGVLVQELAGIFFLTLPLPLFIPAMIMENFPSVLRRLRLPRGMAMSLGILTVYSVIFWGIIAWSRWVAQIPEQIPGPFTLWVFWYLASVPLFTFLTFIALRRLDKPALTLVAAK
jgi:hypothetical protein